MSEINKLFMEQIESGKLLIRQTESGDFFIEKADSNMFPSVADTHKDRIFRMIFKHKRELLMLYNALHNTCYDNPKDLSVTTLENAIYLGMRNDVSFVLYDRLMLYEHQSTKNPNIPLRNLFYVADVYSNLTKDNNLFSTKLFKIPAPQFVVFYNGVDKMSEKSTLRLSDMYEHASGELSLELITHVFNINLGHNKELMDKCKALHDYAVFVDMVRRYQKTMSIKLAVNQAVNECIAADVLADFLATNKAEVIKMSLYEYDEKKHIQMERAEAREEAWEEAWKEAQEEGRKNSIINVIETSQELNSSSEDTIQRIMRKFFLSESEAQNYVAQYWKK